MVKMQTSEGLLTTKTRSCTATRFSCKEKKSSVSARNRGIFFLVSKGFVNFAANLLSTLTFSTPNSMILGKVSDTSRIKNLNPYFGQLFKFVRENDLSKFATQRIVLDGENLFINMAEPELKSADEQKLEVHRKYIDVHFPLTGDEICGITHIDDLSVESDAPFNEEDDFALYNEKARNYFTIHPGEFYIVFHEDAHAPIIGEGKIKKAIAKVLVIENNYDLPY